jgi:hypothetical protein
VKAQHRQAKSQAQLPSLQTPRQRPYSICGATSDLGGRPGYLDGRLRLARPKVPSAAFPWQGGPRGRAATWRKLPRAARDVQEQRGGRICLVRRSGHDEIFPSVASGLPWRPITWIMSSGKGHMNPLLTRRQTTRLDPAGIRGLHEKPRPNSTCAVMGQEKPPWNRSRNYSVLQRLPRLA